MVRKLYTLEVTLTGGDMTDEFVRANPVVSRTIEIRARETLSQLHRVIFGAFGRRDDDHLHEFEFGRRPHDPRADRYVLPVIHRDPEEVDDPSAAGCVTRTRLGDLELRMGQVFWYVFDHDENWYHRIAVVATGEAEPKVRYPRVIAMVGESPPQHPMPDGDDQREADDGMSDALRDDWVADVLEGWDGVEDAGSGTTPLMDGESVAWVKRRIPVDLSWEVRAGATHRTYRVTTITDLRGGTSIIGTYLVPGFYLPMWLGELRKPSDDPEIVLSVEVV